VGAMVSATDPVAVIATFRQLRTPEALATLVEGESLLNDGTGLVLYTIAVGAVSSPTSVAAGIGTFVVAVAVSAAVGLLAGVLVTRLLGTTDDHLIELTLSLVLAYGTYLAAEELHASGIIATVVAAVVLGTGRSTTISPAGVQALDTVWEFIAFVLTAIVFLLIGFAIEPGSLVTGLGPIAVAIAGAILARALVAYGLLGIPAWILRRARPDSVAAGVPIGWLHVVFWAGLRGAVAVAMALALPADLEQRSLLQQITFGVVLFTLIIQGTTAHRVVARALRAGPPGRPAA
jgi:CPA1 family monovalent cation:H+ antiporter